MHSRGPVNAVQDVSGSTRIVTSSPPRGRDDLAGCRRMRRRMALHNHHRRVLLSSSCNYHPPPPQSRHQDPSPPPRSPFPLASRCTSATPHTTSSPRRTSSLSILSLLSCRQHWKLPALTSAEADLPSMLPSEPFSTLAPPLSTASHLSMTFDQPSTISKQGCSACWSLMGSGRRRRRRSG